MPSSYTTTRRVEFSDTDMAGIVHFSAFYRWMEQAEHEFFRTLGLTIVNHRPDGRTFGWPRVMAQCRFQSPAKYEDVLRIDVYLQRIGLKSLTWDVIFHIDDRLVATGVMKTVCCVVEPGKPLQSVAIPDEYLSKLQEHPERPNPEGLS